MVEEMNFRPALVVFVEEAGNSIYGLFCSSGLLERIHKPLQQGIVLLRMLPDDKFLYRLLKTPEEQATEKSDLTEALTEAFAVLSNPRNQQYIADAQYKIPINKPHVHIVGHVESPAMKRVLTAVRAISEQRYESITAVHVSYHLCFYSSDPDHRAARMTEATRQWLEQSSVNFCYLYGDDPASGLGAADYSYAVAQSLFTLIATGIVAQPAFQAINQLSPDAPVFNHGTLSTCLISVPHKTIEDGCSNYVAALLLTRWLEQAGKEQVQESVQPDILDDMAKIRQQLEQNSELPTTGIEDSAQPQRDLSQRLIEHTTRLFAHPVDGNSGGLYRVTHVGQRRREVTKLHRQSWETAAAQRWSAFKLWMNEELDAMIRRQWPAPTLEPGIGHPMPSNVIAWADGLDSRLQNLEQACQDLCSEDDNDTAGHLAVNRFIQTIKNEQAKKYLSDHPSEQECANQLLRYVEDQQKQMPSKVVRIIWGLAFLLSISCLSFTFLGSSVITMSISGGMVLLVLLVNFIEYGLKYREKEFTPRRLLRNFSRFMFVRYCERYENKRRLDVVRTLREKLSGLTSTSLRQVSEQLKEEANTVLLTIFDDKLASQRNVFAINKGVLTPLSADMTSSTAVASGKNVGYMQAKELFDEITIDETDTYWKGCEKCLYNSFEQSRELELKGQAPTWQETFRASLFNHTRLTIKKRITRFVYQIDLDLPELWHAIVSRITIPLCSLQATSPRPSHVFLCRSHDYTYTSFKHQLVSDTLGVLEFIPIADNRWLDEAEDSEYLLVAACYGWQTPLAGGSGMQNTLQQGNR